MQIHMLTADLALPAPVLVVAGNLFVRNRLQSLLLQLGYSRDTLLMARSPQEARSYMARGVFHSSSLALVEVGLSGGSGLDLIARLHRREPGLPILGVSAWSMEDVILAALRAGAVGYVLQDRDDLEIALALQSVLRGGAFIDPFMARRLIEEWTAQASQAPGCSNAQALNAREACILRLVVDGLTNREIAEHLLLSRDAVELHIKNIYQKLSVSLHTQAA